MANCNQCNGCSGGCAGCGGCSRSLELTQDEIDFLEVLAQTPFLPVARKASDMVPVYLENGAEAQEHASLLLQVMEKKGLIEIDYDQPLRGADMRAYAAYPVHGSMALTARGQQVLELLELQGAEDEKRS